MNAPAAGVPGGVAPPHLGGGLPWLGHMLAFARNPFRFTERVAAELGEIGSFTLAGQRIVLLTGAAASELFYRSSDEQLDQSAAYKLMTPIFGEGLIFDAPIARKNEQLRMLMPSLRVEAMRDHSHKIVQEVNDIIANWGERGEVDLVAFMKQLTINTASHCLLGREFRYELSEEFAAIYHDLEQGVHPVAYHFPNLPIPRFRRRDRARARLQELIGQIVQKRKAQAGKPTDLFQALIDMRYADGAPLTDNEITGMLVGAIFAGHHTSSGTAAWVLLELLKHPPLMRRTRDELDALLGPDGEVTFQSLREMPTLENVLKEVLRLHPPLIILMRQVAQDLAFKQYTIRAGDMVWACPPVTHRMPELFQNPLVFDPDRYAEDRREDRNLMAWQPFGGGRHKCSGNAFAMFQIKAIFAVLLRRYEFELVDAPEAYVDNYREMIVQPVTPCRVRYRRRAQVGATGTARAPATQVAPPPGCPMHAAAAAPVASQRKLFRIVVDRELCQGHGVCCGEAPGHFRMGSNGVMELVQAEVGEADLPKVEAAVRHCPNLALRLASD